MRAGDTAGVSTPFESYELAELADRQAAGDRPYLEFLRRPALSAGLYVLPDGGVDPQRPHREDEVYVVVTGRADFVTDGRSTPVGPGSVLYVERGAEHRFTEVRGDLQVLVFFAPAETDA